MFSSFWENQLKKEITFICEIKNKIRRTGMHNIYHVFQPPASQFLHRVYYDLWRFLHFKWKKNPTLHVHHIYVLLGLQYMIAADIILIRVMIKLITLCEKNNDADQPMPMRLHSLF